MLRAKGEYEKALSEYNRAVRLAPGVARYYYDRGRNHLAKHDLVWARADLDQAIRLDPTDARARLARGVLHFAEGDVAAAAAEFAAALARAPDDAEAALWLAAARVRSGRDDPAELVRALDTLKPDPCDRSFFTGEAELSRPHRAVPHLQQALERCAPDRLARTGAAAALDRARGQ